MIFFITMCLATAVLCTGPQDIVSCEELFGRKVSEVLLSCFSSFVAPAVPLCTINPETSCSPACKAVMSGVQVFANFNTSIRSIGVKVNNRFYPLGFGP